MAKINLNDILDIGKTVTDVLSRNAAKTGTAMQQSDVPKVAPDVVRSVQEEVKKQLQPVVDNQTNQEPWYKSRVVRGAVLTLLSTVTVTYSDFTDGTTPDMNTILGYGGTILGALYVIYGRFTARGTPTV